MSIILQQLTKRYHAFPVVNNVSLEVTDGEFFVLLGPSGSGKTSILNLIAGLMPVDEGRILLNGRDVTDLPTRKRNIGYVFQHYALFQYMNVAENIEFGLSIHKVPPAQRRKRRDELLELVGLVGLEKRMPDQLSGGQQQRVALARALAHQPEVLLLDEPLGALDAKIRADLRRSLKLIQRKLGITTILVTHDQEETFDIADRIGVMSYGRLVEVGTPQGLYQRPQTEFVASFLGTANVLVGNLLPGGVQVGPVKFHLQEEVKLIKNDPRVQVLFRPEDVTLAPVEEELACPTLGYGTVEEISFAGTFERVRLRLAPIPGVRPISPPVTFGSNAILIDATRPPEWASRFPLHPGDHSWVGVHRMHALPHPGLNFLIVTDDSPRSQAAAVLGGQIARLSHARVTLLACGQTEEAAQAQLESARQLLGGGLAALDLLTSTEAPGPAVARTIERQPQDLVVFGFDPAADLPLAERILQAGNHHLLLVPSNAPVPTRPLVCVANGEPGKDDVLFAGRLVRHLGASVTVLTVLPAGQANSDGHARAERFLESSVQSLSVLGVPGTPVVRSGGVLEEITREMQSERYDLLVIGAPLPGAGGKPLLAGVAAQVLSHAAGRPLMIVQSHSSNR
jgi:sulfate/thiosulfate transport system ATP-binding protein